MQELGDNFPAAHLWTELSSGGRNWFPGDLIPLDNWHEQILA